MKNVCALRQALESGAYADRLARLYCCRPEDTGAQSKRYLSVLNGLDESFGPHDSALLFSAPGRTEIGGNHTDHQHGRVLAGSVNIDMIAAAAPNSMGRLRVQSEGYDLCVIDLSELEVRPEEANTSASILRGTCAAFVQRGAKLSGLDIYISSNVPKGSGVSSSAAFEVLIGTILNEVFFGVPGAPAKVSAVEIAQIGQYAENVYFGKPSGLMDQTASSVGNIITIDFADPAAPVVQPVEVDFAKAGLALCIVDSGADHADLTGEYAAVPLECRAVAKVCGAEVLRDVPEEVFLKNLPACRAACGDRAVLRAFHFYADNDRVPMQVKALQQGDYDTFLRLVTASGDSSWELLQNVVPAGYKEHQEVAVALAVARRILAGRGAVRIHGGGFAGTIQAFVPIEMLETFRTGMEAALGEGRCHVLAIRPEGGTVL
jgi:galactokinase